MLFQFIDSISKYGLFFKNIIQSAEITFIFSKTTFIFISLNKALLIIPSPLVQWISIINPPSSRQ